MNTDQNNSVNTVGQKKVWSNSNGTRRHTIYRDKACLQETPSSVCRSPGVIRKSDTSARRSNDGSENLLENTLENNLSKPATLFVELNETEYTLTKDEIVYRRKLKVAARKKLKKIEKMQMNEKVTVELVEKPGFSLQLASEDFPTLNAHNTKKRFNTSHQETSITDVENDSTEQSSVIIDTKCSKTVEKSWKPKVKDPIHIDLSQVLLNKNEKQKPGLKKADPPTQRNSLAGNILDSDNPIRKKGKVRPDKVQKPSKLKSHILIERKKKLSDTKENTSGNSECSLYETTENDYIKPGCVVEKVDDKNALFTSSDFTHSVTTVSEKKIIETNQKVISCVFPANIHSRRFREYCTNCLTEEVIASVCALLEKVAYFQDRMYAREPIKASAKRRYVAGINQVSKYLQVRKVKLLVIAPDLEKNPGEGGLDERVQYFKMEAESQGIPCVFGPNRKRLGKAVKKNTLVSCVAVLSYEGAEDQYAQVLAAVQDGKTKYLRLIGFHEDDDTKNVQDIHSKAKESYTSTSDITSSLLATLREELPPADRLLNAIRHSGASAEE